MKIENLKLQIGKGLRYGVRRLGGLRYGRLGGLRYVVAGLLLLLAVGCAGTVTPRIVKDPVASWDGTNQNSSFIGYAADGSGIITAHGRDRYNGLVGIFGGKFVPQLKADEGITPAVAGEPVFDQGKPIGVAPVGCYRIDPQHLDYFFRMNRWRKQAGGQ